MDAAPYALIAAAAGAAPVWLVGGAVRDLLRGVAPADLDLAVAGDGLALARAIADAGGGAYVPLDSGRATGRAVLPGGLVIDCAALRAPTIEADLRLRDFTINALALPLAAAQAGDLTALIDPAGGGADLRAGRLRACGPTSLADDPLRVLRAGRLRATLGALPAADMAPAARAAAAGLGAVAAERVRDELLKLCDGPHAAAGLRLIDSYGALTVIIPELEPARACDQPRVHFLPVLAHMIETVAALDWLIDGGAPPAPGADPALAALAAAPGLSRQLPYAEHYAALLAGRRGGVRRAALLKLAALLHDSAKPQTKVAHADGSVTFYGHQEIGAERAAAIGRRLRLSRADVSYLAQVVAAHMRPGQMRGGGTLTGRGVARFFRETGDAGPDVLLHELADHLATRGPHVDPAGWAAHLAWVAELLAAYWDAPAAAAPPVLRGDELMAELGIAAGPLVGRLLRLVAEAQAAGEIQTRAEALALARAAAGEGVP